MLALTRSNTADMMRSMRASAPGPVLLAVALAAFSVGAAGCDACKKKEEAKSPTVATTEGAEGVIPPTQVKERPRDFDPITPEEVMPMVPTLTGASFMRDPQVVAGGRRVIVWICVDGRDQATVHPELKQKLDEIGFGQYAIKTRKRREPFDDVNWIRGEKDKFRLSASLRRGEYEGCKASEGKTRVTLTFMKHMPPRSLEKTKRRRAAAAAENGTPAPAPTPAAAVDAGFGDEE